MNNPEITSTESATTAEPTDLFDVTASGQTKPLWRLTKIKFKEYFWRCLIRIALVIVSAQIVFSLATALIIELSGALDRSSIFLDQIWIYTFGVTIFIGGLLSVTTYLPLNLAAGYIRRDIAKSLLLTGGFFSVLCALVATVLSVLSKWFGATPIIEMQNTVDTGTLFGYLDPDTSLIGSLLLFYAAYATGLVIGTLYRVTNSTMATLLLFVAVIPIVLVSAFLLRRMFTGSWDPLKSMLIIPVPGVTIAVLLVGLLSSFWIIFAKTKIPQPQ